MEARLLSIPSINWAAFAHLTKKYLGETPTTKLDKLKIPCDNPDAYHQCLVSLFEKDKEKPLSLINVSFLLWDAPQNIHKVTKYIETQEIDAVENQLCFASGAVADWVLNVYDACPLPLANAIYLEFYQHNLGFAFDNYKRVVHEDKKTFKLVRK